MGNGVGGGVTNPAWLFPLGVEVNTHPRSTGFSLSALNYPATLSNTFLAPIFRCGIMSPS